MADGEARQLDVRGRINGRATLTFKTWLNIKKRCYVKHHKTYPDYGGRGIKMYFDWVGPGGFAQFVRDVGPRPGPNYHLDRIDPSKHYEPDNVRWRKARLNLATYTPVGLTAIGPDGQEHTLTRAQWAKFLKLTYRTFTRRLRNATTDEERAAVFRSRRRR